MYEYEFLTLACIGLDILTGTVKAFFTTGLNSKIMREGGKHKASEILAILFGKFIGYALAFYELSIGIDVQRVICTYIFIMESISIIENIGVLNPKALPEEIKKFFEKLNKEEE